MKEQQLRQLTQEIRNTASEYVSPHLLNEYVNQLRRWPVDFREYFFQMGQLEAEPVLEIVGWTGQLLVDITATENLTRTTVVRVSKIVGLVLKETGDSTQLDISTGRQRLVYESTSSDRRKRLASFAQNLQTVLGERGTR
jgi:hypothetical protein